MMGAINDAIREVIKEVIREAIREAASEPPDEGRNQGDEVPPSAAISERPRCGSRDVMRAAAYHGEIGTFAVIQPVGIALRDLSWQRYILGLGDRGEGLWSQPADFGVFARLRARRTRDGEVVHREFTVGTQSHL